ncbi:MAG: Hsp20/alpha crystallin family protein [Phycisphaerales bacterium]|nr:MAG: Hsp20/alpha crystallin family protein [Phycisphaerales bacterium]
MIFGSNVFYPMNRLRMEMDRLFDDFSHEFPMFGRVAGLHGRGYPSLNVWEDEHNLFIEAEVPGMKMEDLEVTVLGHELTIKGQRGNGPAEGVTYHRRERGVGSFSRTLRLLTDVSADKVEAGLVNGVLTVTLPKAEAAKPRKIEVKST